MENQNNISIREIREGSIPPRRITFNNQLFNRVGEINGFIYKSFNMNKKIISTYSEPCSNCKRAFHQKWTPKTFECNFCNEIKNLKKEKEEQILEITNLKETINLDKENLEDFISKSQNWHQKQLDEKNEENDQLRDKIQSLEEKINQLETKYSELIIEKN